MSVWMGVSLRMAVVGVVLLAVSMARAAEADVERLERDTWDLSTAYGMTDSGQGPVSAEVVVKPEGYLLRLISQGSSLLEVRYAGLSKFEGMLTWKSGRVQLTVVPWADERAMAARL